MAVSQEYQVRGLFGGVCAREVTAKSTGHPCSNDDDDDDERIMDEEAGKVSRIAMV